MLDLGTRVAREMEHILFDYIQQGVKTARELARRLIKSEKLEDKLKLMHFIEQIFIFSQPTPIRQAILTITTIRPMIKQL